MGVGLLKRRAGEAARAAIWQSSKAGKWWAHQGKSGLMTAPSSAGGRVQKRSNTGVLIYVLLAFRLQPANGSNIAALVATLLSPALPLSGPISRSDPIPWSRPVPRSGSGGLAVT